MTNNTQALSMFLKKKQIDISVTEGEIISVQEIARRADIAQASMNAYFLGGQTPTGKNLHKLAEFFGMEIYTIMGIDIPMPPGLKAIAAIYDRLPPDKQQELEKLAHSLENGGSPAG